MTDERACYGCNDPATRTVGPFAFCATCPPEQYGIDPARFGLLEPTPLDRPDPKPMPEGGLNYAEAKKHQAFLRQQRNDAYARIGELERLVVEVADLGTQPPPPDSPELRRARRKLRGAAGAIAMRSTSPSSQQPEGGE